MNRLTKIFTAFFSIVLLCNCDNSSVGEEKVTAEIDSMIPKTETAKKKSVTACNCDVRAGVDNSITVYPLPKDSAGKIFTIKNDCEFFRVEIEKYADGWLKLRSLYADTDDCGENYHDTFAMDPLYCWIKAGTAFTGGPDVPHLFKLYRLPNDTTSLCGYTKGGWKIFGCKGKWILGEGTDFKEKEILGWVPPELQCAVFRTNCTEWPTEYIYKFVE